MTSSNGTAPAQRTRIAAFSVRMRGGQPAFAQCAGCGDTWPRRAPSAFRGPGDLRCSYDLPYEDFVAEHTHHTERPD